MTTQSTTRRAVLAGIAIVPAASLVATPTDALATLRARRAKVLREIAELDRAIEPIETAMDAAMDAADPIFAAIEAHKAAYETWALAVGVEAHLSSGHPDAAEADRITAEASCAFEASSMALAKIQPTTLAGIVALIEYIDAFNHAAFQYPSGSSGHHGWPWREGEEAVEIGAPIVLPFPYLVMNNIRNALAKLIAA